MVVAPGTGRLRQANIASNDAKTAESSMGKT